MKSYLPPFGLAALAMLAGCTTNPSATSESWPSSLGTVPNKVSSAGPATPHRDVPSSIEIADDATLDDLLHYAAERSPRLRAAFYEWKAAVERIPQARSLPDPNLSYAYFLERMETRQTASISQMFPWFGKRALKGEIAGEAAQAAAARFEAERLELFEKVKSRYAEYLYIEQAVRIARENQAILGQFEEVALARFRAGETGNADVLRVQMEVDRLEDEVQTTEAMRAPTAAALNAVLGRAVTAPLPDPQEIKSIPALAEIPERSPEEWLAENPLLRAASHEVVRDELGVDLAGREGRPDFTVGVEVMDNVGMAPNEVMVMASINLPIWRERYAAARREARAVHEGAIADHESLQRELEATLQRTLFELRDAERKIRLYGQALLPRARQTFNSLQGAYRTGESDFLDLVEAQRTLLDVELSYQRALADRVQRLAEFESLIGYNLENALPTTDTSRSGRDGGSE